MVVYNVYSDATIFPAIFTKKWLAVTVERNNTILDAWNFCGYLYPVIKVEDTLLQGIAIPIEFGGTIINIPYKRYQLKFRAARWIDNSNQLQIQFKEVDPAMGINFANNQQQLISSEVITTVATNASAVILRASNSAFAEGFIVNNSNKILYVIFADVPAITAAAPISSVPAKGNIDIPSNYTGVIQGIWNGNDNSGKAEIHQFNYL